MYWGRVWLLWSTEHVEFRPWIRIKHQRQQQNIQQQELEQESMCTSDQFWQPHPSQWPTEVNPPTSVWGSIAYNWMHQQQPTQFRPVTLAIIQRSTPMATVQILTSTPTRSSSLLSWAPSLRDTVHGRVQRGTYRFPWAPYYRDKWQKALLNVTFKLVGCVLIAVLHVDNFVQVGYCKKNLIRCGNSQLYNYAGIEIAITPWNDIIRASERE